MKRRISIPAAILLAVSLLVGGLLGAHIRNIRDAELFYRWILAQAVQSRIFSDLANVDSPTGAHQDLPFFARIIEAAGPLLPDVQVTAEDKDDQGKPLSKLAKLARDEANEDQVWSLVRDPAMAPLRKEFFRLLREKKLTNIASEFDPNAVYGGQGASVNLGNIFLGFRKVAANFVWLQVDRYWHQGLVHRMIPLMNTCVTLDPNFVDAYLLGAWHLAYNATAKMLDTPEPLKKLNPRYGVRLGEKETYYYLAIDFLKNGILKNPRNYKLYFDLGFGIYKIKLKDYANAVKYLSEAIRQRHDKWVPRQLCICMELNGQFEEALAGWKNYLEDNPGNLHAQDVAPRFITRNEGRIKEREAENAIERARNATNPAEAEAARAQAEKLRDEAIAISETMGTDPYAKGRILRLKAFRLAEKQRFLEAVAVLENARWESSELFDEASDLIIKYKTEAGIPLSTSEKKAVLRKQEAEQYKNQPTPEAETVPK